MGKVTKLDDLEIYTESLKLAKAVFDICKNPALKKEFSLCDQLKRAAITVPANIAEGFGRRTKLDFGRFLSISIGSSNEMLALLDILSLSFRNIKTKDLKERYIILGRRIYSFRRILKITNN